MRGELADFKDAHCPESTTSFASREYAFEEGLTNDDEGYPSFHPIPEKINNSKVSKSFL
jgi:hypothetical protein